MKPLKGIRRNVGRKCERYAESATDNIMVLKQSHLVLKISYTEATSISCSQGRSARSPTATVCCVIEAVHRFYIYRSYGELHQCTSHMFEAALSIGSGSDSATLETRISGNQDGSTRLLTPAISVRDGVSTVREYHSCPVATQVFTRPSFHGPRRTEYRRQKTLGTFSIEIDESPS